MLRTYESNLFNDLLTNLLKLCLNNNSGPKQYII